MKKFRVEFGYTQYSTANVIIEAESRSEAEELAGEMLSDDERLEFKRVDGELFVPEIEELV